MANQTDPFAQQIHGANPQYLIEKITRLKIYNSVYWKEECFGLTAETIIDKAVALKYCGGVYGGSSQPTKFLCLILKMLQLQPEKDIVLEYLNNEDFKYLRILGAFYIRMICKAEEVYRYLEPLYNDYRKLSYRGVNGWQTKHIDEFIDELLNEELVCDISLPHIPKRSKLEDLNLLRPRESVLDFELIDDGQQTIKANDSISNSITEIDEITSKENISNNETNSKETVDITADKRANVVMTVDDDNDDIDEFSRDMLKTVDVDINKVKDHASERGKGEGEDKDRDRDRNRERDSSKVIRERSESRDRNKVRDSRDRNRRDSRDRRYRDRSHSRDRYHSRKDSRDRYRSTRDSRDRYRSRVDSRDRGGRDRSRVDSRDSGRRRYEIENRRHDKTDRNYDRYDSRRPDRSPSRYSDDSQSSRNSRGKDFDDNHVNKAGSRSESSSDSDSDYDSSSSSSRSRSSSKDSVKSSHETIKPTVAAVSSEMSTELNNQPDSSLLLSASEKAISAAKAAKKFDKLFRPNKVVTHPSTSSSKTTAAKPVEEGSVEYWNQKRESLGLKKLRE